MVDLHIHILPGLDDGPDSLDGTLELARACVADGVTALAATPHVSERYPTTPQQISTALAQTRAALITAGIQLDVRAGAEIAIDQMSRLSDQDLRDLTIAAGGSHLLLETPYSGWPMDIEAQIGRLAALGIRAILAHPERSRGVQEHGGVERLARLVGRGMLVQVTAGSISGRFGRSTSRLARELLDKDLIHVISSDAHNEDRRPPRMSEAAREVGDESLAQWLTTFAPEAILNGDRLPPRPERARRRRTLSFLRRG